MNKKSYNGLLILGISIILIGLALLIYCITSYSEVKLVTDKIDFDELDNNIHMSTSDKYYQHISIFDMLNQKLEKNKKLPIKNMSCAYLDYSQHNITSLYKLIFKNANEDVARRTVVEENIKSLMAMYDNYKQCKKASLYRDELKDMLDEVENSDDIYYQGRMETFVNGGKDIERAAGTEGNTPQYSEQGIQPAYENTNNSQIQYAQSSSSGMQNQTYNQVQQYNSQNTQHAKQEYYPEYSQSR